MSRLSTLISRSFAILLVIGFFLPWITVSISNESIVSLADDLITSLFGESDTPLLDEPLITISASDIVMSDINQQRESIEQAQQFLAQMGVVVNIPSLSNINLLIAFPVLGALAFTASFLGLFIARIGYFVSGIGGLLLMGYLILGISSSLGMMGDAQQMGIPMTVSYEIGLTLTLVSLIALIIAGLLARK